MAQSSMMTRVAGPGVYTTGLPPANAAADAELALAGAPYSGAPQISTGPTGGIDSTVAGGIYDIGSSQSSALGMPSFNLGGVGSAIAGFGGGFSVPALGASLHGTGSAAMAATAGLGVFPAFAALPAMFALQGLMSYLGPSKPRASVAFEVKDGVVYPKSASSTSGAPSLGPWGDALAAYANAQFQGNAPENWSGPSLSTGHKALDSPSFAAPAIFQSGGRESAGSNAFYKGSAPIRYYPGETDFEEFAGAWIGNQDQRLSLASGMNAIGMNLNTNYIADPTMFTELEETGRDSGGAINLFTPEQMRVADIGRS